MTTDDLNQHFKMLANAGISMERLINIAVTQRANLVAEHADKVLLDWLDHRIELWRTLAATSGSPEHSPFYVDGLGASITATGQEALRQILSDMSGTDGISI